MKIGCHLEVVTWIKDMNPDLKSEKKIGLEEQLQDSGYFFLEQTSFLWIVSPQHLQKIFNPSQKIQACLVFGFLFFKEFITLNP